MAKTAKTAVQSENAPKRVKIANNDQKMAKMAKKWEKLDKKIDFLYNNFPEKVISLRKCTKNFSAFGEKKLKKNSSCVETPPRGGVKKNSSTQPHSHTSLYRSLIGSDQPLIRI